jgi:citrate synthase
MCGVDYKMTLKYKDSTKYLGVKEGTVTERWIEIESLIERLNKIDVWNINAYHELNKLKEELEHLKEVN